MNKLIRSYRATRGFLAALALLIITQVSLFAQAGAVETAALDMVDDGKTAGQNVLVAVIGILAAYVIFKLVKRAVSKA